MKKSMLTFNGEEIGSLREMRESDFSALTTFKASLNDAISRCSWRIGQIFDVVQFGLKGENEIERNEVGEVDCCWKQGTQSDFAVKKKGF